MTFTVPAGAFKAKGKSGDYEYKYDAKKYIKKAKFKWELKVKTKKGEFHFKAEHLNTDTLSPSNGLAVKLYLGDQSGQEDVPVIGKGKHLKEWKYHADHKLLCDKLDKPPKGGNGNCDGKVTELELSYNGATAASVEVKQKDSTVLFSGTVLPGGTFTFIGKDKDGTMGTEISIYVNGSLDTQIHTSCSKPIGIGLVSGSFTIIDGESLKGGTLSSI